MEGMSRPRSSMPELRMKAAILGSDIVVPVDDFDGALQSQRHAERLTAGDRKDGAAADPPLDDPGGQRATVTDSARSSSFRRQTPSQLETYVPSHGATTSPRSEANVLTQINHKSDFRGQAGALAVGVDAAARTLHSSGREDHREQNADCQASEEAATTAQAAAAAAAAAVVSEAAASHTGSSPAAAAAGQVKIGGELDQEREGEEGCEHASGVGPYIASSAAGAVPAGTEPISVEEVTLAYALNKPEESTPAMVCPPKESMARGEFAFLGSFKIEERSSPQSAAAAGTAVAGPRQGHSDSFIAMEALYPDFSRSGRTNHPDTRGCNPQAPNLPVNARPQFRSSSQSAAAAGTAAAGTAAAGTAAAGTAAAGLGQGHSDSSIAMEALYPGLCQSGGTKAVDRVLTAAAFKLTWLAEGLSPANSGSTQFTHSGAVLPRWPAANVGSFGRIIKLKGQGHQVVPASDPNSRPITHPLPPGVLKSSAHPTSSIGDLESLIRVQTLTSSFATCSRSASFQPPSSEAAEAAAGAAQQVPTTAAAAAAAAVAAVEAEGEPPSRAAAAAGAAQERLALQQTDGSLAQSTPWQDPSHHRSTHPPTMQHPQRPSDPVNRHSASGRGGAAAGGGGDGGVSGPQGSAPPKRTLLRRLGCMCGATA